MRQTHAVGRNASAIKYDILTALLVLAAQDPSPKGRLAGRLALLVTARFNWARGTFASGTREIARMWGVTERTAKRELAAMRSLGWISVHRPAARGRVTEHRIDIDAVLDGARPYWAAIGPDFVARMVGDADARSAGETNVVPFAPGASASPPRSEDGSLWSSVSRDLWARDSALHAAWFATLTEAERTPTSLTLLAPTRFAASYVETHFAGRLLAAISARDPGITHVRVAAAAEGRG
ncbi:MAG: DnaA N-terminal domain-containing protein [Pseudomonadota bacterium]